MPFLNRFCLVCVAAMLCAYTLIARAEELPSEKIHSEEKRSKVASQSERVFEANLYYTNIGYNIPLTDQPIPTISSDSETVIYRELIEGSFVPRYMAIEANVNPLPWMSTYIKSHSPSFYRQAEIDHSGINLLESATADFLEPWAVSVFFGNMAKLQRPNEPRHGNNYGYTGYLVSAGNKHIKNNTLIADDWYELQWRIKGRIDYPDEHISWSFRIGGRFNNNKDVNDVTFISLHRSNLDFRYPFLEWLENANFDWRIHLLQHGGQMVRQELIFGKKIPLPDWGYTPTLDIGVVWSSPNEYSGALKDMREDTTTLVFRPSIEF